MHTADLFDEAIRLVKCLDYSVRQEWLGGCGGGGCELNHKKILFLDLANGPDEQLEQVLETLCREPAVTTLPMVRQLRDLLEVRKTA